jgi:DNA-binding transcriptional LysR family regulator
MIDRYLLRYFSAVIDYGSFSKAAKHLNVAQPTLSIGIGKLERLLGAPLFHRSSRRVHLTEAGSRLATHARRIENEFNAAEAAVRGMKPIHALRIGVLSTYPMAQLAEIIRLAKRSNERERLQIVTGNERELSQRLQRGQIEVALSIIRPESDRFVCERLFSECYALALPNSHALADKPQVSAEELADNTMIVRRHCEVLSETSRHFTERGVRPYFAFRSTNDEQVLALVHAGLGVTVMPASYTMKGVVRPLLAGFELQREIGFLYAAHAEHFEHTPSTLLDSIRSRYARSRASMHKLTQ